MLSMAVKITMTKSNLVGGRVCLVYRISLLEASLREMRAGTKAEQRWEPGKTAEHRLTHPFPPWLFSQLFLFYSQVCLPRDGMVGQAHLH